MSYEPNAVAYIGGYYDPEIVVKDNPEINDIIPVLDNLFMDTEIALCDLTDACSRNHLESAYKKLHEIYDKVADLRQEYRDITTNLNKVI